ncbi:DUF6090 family protein [Robiginitalea aurantiaca]|uniref:DUF6090 family protein n=1 Tax=Robiginitalea aurantiaca TaxID=3056915 RepID=A0ABT7WBI7_9FLAO|nr:DUF6090 family protein [Robiginitalea aurantiaca]MDM9630263.1 DUF6090 family protein [Robiginitalea aurantiaca]
MIRFFRQIRQRLITDNKFSKYLLYAIGEILLVVIGILIALQVDNWNEERKNDEKITTILSDIMDELILDINSSTDLMKYYALRDSTIFLVLTNQLTMDDYEANKIPHLYNASRTLTSFTPRKDTYLVLNQNLDIVPDSYKDLLGELSELYNRYYRIVEDQNQVLQDLLAETTRIRSQYYAWHSSNSPDSQKSRIEFMLNDFRYKNEVMDYRDIAIYNQLNWTIRYRQKAIECFKNIAKALDNSGYDDSFVFNQEVSKILIGDWKVVGEPETIISFFDDDKRLYYKDNINSGRHEVFWLPPYKILSDDLLYGSIIKDGNKHFLMFNSFDLQKVDE